MKRLILAAGLAMLALPAAADMHRSVPRTVGSCVRTSVAAVTQRLYNTLPGGGFSVVPGSGSAITFTNGLHQEGYEQVAAINHSEVGDPVSICLAVRPANCPPGVAWGKTYTTTNLRTGQVWTLGDDEHSCNG